MPSTYPDHSKSPSGVRYTVGGDGLVRLELALPLDAFDALLKLARQAGTSVDDVAVRLLRAPGYSDAAEDLLRDLAGKTHDTREGSLLKALILYRDAAEAEAQGHRFAIINGDDEIVRDYSGLGGPDPEPAALKPVPKGS
jgi:hypothetical protein